MSPALAEAYRRADEIQRRVKRLRPVSHTEPVVRPRPTLLARGVAHRPAIHVRRERPIDVLRPVPPSDQEISAFVRAEFAEAAKKRERR